MLYLSANSFARANLFSFTSSIFLPVKWANSARCGVIITSLFISFKSSRERALQASASITAGFKAFLQREV